MPKRRKVRRKTAPRTTEWERKTNAREEKANPGKADPGRKG